MRRYNAISMPRANIMPAHLKPIPIRHALGALLLCLTLAPPAHAERADRQQPLNAEADALTYDDARRTSVFTGNVLITKGSIIIRGARVEVRQDDGGNQFGTVTGNAARPAYFRQKRDGVDEHIEGTAERIEYDSQTESVVFRGQAVMRRLRGESVSDETRGEVIRYNNRSDVFSVDGTLDGQAGAAPGGGRVRAVLTPAPKPASPAATPAPKLQPSPRLEPKR